MSSTDPASIGYVSGGHPAAEPASANTEVDTGPSSSAGAPPHTGQADIDAALAQLNALEQLPPARQLQQLTAAQETLANILNNSRESS